MTCPKCGQKTAFTGPKYRPAVHGMPSWGLPHQPECLVYTCQTCGYEAKTPCLDATEKR